MCPLGELIIARKIVDVVAQNHNDTLIFLFIYELLLFVEISSTLFI